MAEPPFLDIVTFFHCRTRGALSRAAISHAVVVFDLSRELNGFAPPLSSGLASAVGGEECACCRCRETEQLPLFARPVISSEHGLVNGIQSSIPEK